MRIPLNEASDFEALHFGADIYAQVTEKWIISGVYHRYALLYEPADRRDNVFTFYHLFYKQTAPPPRVWGLWKGRSRDTTTTFLTHDDAEFFCLGILCPQCGLPYTDQTHYLCPICRHSDAEIQNKSV